ncbi:MAG: tetratricopeptide repeat protein [Acidobacteria bacterium]|nr:tetratricopeptide repeat protein [Acidobacteriota bacterium]
MRHATVSLLGFILPFGLLQSPASAQSRQDQVQIAPPMRTIGPPPADATAEQLETTADELRARKAYLESMDYFRVALLKQPSPQIYNKMGIVELQTYHLGDAKRDFERAIKLDGSQADALNNLGVVYYEAKKYGKAIKYYNKAIAIRPDMASYYSNLGAALFSKKDYEKATASYARALELDPAIFERTSRTGVAAQLPSPQDRARYEYVMARLYAKMGRTDDSLQCLRKAMEQGYKDINMVYKDAEFSVLRKDPRFAELMATKPPAIPE